MRFAILVSTLFLSICASPVGATVPTILGAPPVVARTFSSKPLIAINTPVFAPPVRAGLSAAVAPAAVALKILVVDGETTEISYQAITTFLNQIGVPYDAVVLSNITPDASGNRLSGITLSNSATGQGQYQGIILTDSTFGLCNPSCSSLLSTSDWSKLDTYATQFSVRIVSYFTWPEAKWGLVAADSGASYKTSNALQASLTAAGAAVFPYLNGANPIPVAGNADSGVWAYLAMPTAGTNETTTSLLTVSGHTLAVTHTTAAGEESLALTFDNYPTLLHSLAFNYGIINWVTKGVFLGSRKIYLSPQIDDMLIGDRLYAPTLPQCPADPSCPTVRTTAGDLNALDAWQGVVRQNSQFQNFRDTFAYVGIGTTSDYSPPGDPLLSAVTELGSQFGWVNHTWSHSSFDCYTATNGVCNPATLAQSLSEIQQNVAIAATLGISIDPTSIVTPYNSGLSNRNFLTAAAQEGIQSVIYPGSDPSPNTGIADPILPSILEIPRLYTNLFDNVDSPTPGAYGSWPDEYNAQYGPNGTAPTFSQNQTYSQILDNESENVLLLNMLSGQLTPIGFHISDIYAYDGIHSLYSDLMDATIAKYQALFNLPVLTLKMSDMYPLLIGRAGYNASGVTGVYTPGVNVVLTTVNAATIPITGACSQGTCPTYGGQLQDSVLMAAQSTVTLSLSAGQGIALSSVSLNPSTVTGGTPSTGTVTLSGPAPSGGVVIGLSSNGSSATVPASVTVNAGSFAATFAVATTAVTASTTATITASYNGVNVTAALSITPAVALSSVTLNPSSVAGGSPSTGTVTLSAPAPASGVSVTLSSNSSSATVPSSVSVTAGNATATFAVTTTAVGSSTAATIKASYNGVNKSAPLTITPVVALLSVTLSPTSVTGGNPSTGKVTLSAPAPAGGLSIALSSNNSSATVPASVNVTAGRSTATFTVTTTAVTPSTTATITASYNGVNKTALITILPATLSSVSLSPTSVTGGNSSTGRITLTGAAPAGGISIALSSNSSSATVPSIVVVVSGSSTATFTVTTTAVTSSMTATITASYNGVNKTARLGIIHH